MVRCTDRERQVQTEMKNRNIPFGYQYQDGKIALHPQEREIVVRISQAYLAGASLLQIAERLNADGVEYLPGVTGWNKARLKRIIEDERYLGRKPYPALLDPETFDAMQRLKADKNTLKGLDRSAPIFQIDVPARCPVCGGKMYRKCDTRFKVQQRWICPNPACKRWIAKSDDELLSEIMALLNRLIAKPEMIRIPAASEMEPSVAVRKLDNEVGRMLESPKADKDGLRRAMLQRVAAAYRDIPNDVYIARRMRADFANAEPLSTFSADLCNRTVKAICFHEDGTVGILLINDQEIGEEPHGNCIATKDRPGDPGDRGHGQPRPKG